MMSPLVFILNTGFVYNNNVFLILCSIHLPGKTYDNILEFRFIVVDLIVEKRGNPLSSNYVTKSNLFIRPAYNKLVPRIMTDIGQFKNTNHVRCLLY